MKSKLHPLAGIVSEIVGLIIEGAITRATAKEVLRIMLDDALGKIIEEEEP